MRVSIVNLNLVGADAIGQCILNQTRYFLRRGDYVRIYTHHDPFGVPADIVPSVTTTSLAHLAAERDEHFRRSDLFVYHYPGRYPLMDTIRGLDRGAVIFYYHNVTPPELWDGPAEDREAMQHSLDSVSALAHYADLIVTPSAFNADSLVNEHGLDRATIRVLPLAVDLSQFAPGSKPAALLSRYGLSGKRTLLYVGRLASNKRPDLLVEALSLVRRQLPNVVLLLVGDNDSNPPFKEMSVRLRALADELGVTESVLMTGRVEDVPAHFRLADVYLSASLHEGFGVPLIEAMASGVPLVVSDAAAHPSVVGDAGLLFAAGDAGTMAQQVLRLLEDDALYGEMVRRGLCRARAFSLEAYMEGWGRIVGEATAPLPLQGFPRGRALVSGVPSSAPAPAEDDAQTEPPSVEAWRQTLLAELGHADSLSDVMLRGYVVRSRLPLIGPLVAWVRRNLTSHLREPYMDPIIERQIAYNRQLLALLRHLVEGMPALVRELRSAEDTRPPTDTAPAAVEQLDRIEATLSLVAAHLAQQSRRDRKPDKERSIPPASQTSR